MFQLGITDPVIMVTDDGNSQGELPEGLPALEVDEDNDELPRNVIDDPVTVPVAQAPLPSHTDVAGRADL